MVSVVRPLADPNAWRQLCLVGSGVPAGVLGAVAFGLLAGPPVVALLADVHVESGLGVVDLGSPGSFGVWCAAAVCGLVLLLGVLAADRAVVARLVPRSMVTTWPRWGWRRFFGTDLLWRQLLWLVVRTGFGVATLLWTWLVASGIAALLRGTWPPSTGALWRLVAGLAAGVVLVLAGFHAARGVGWLLTRLAHELLGPSPTKRIAELDARATSLQQRAELARELHDSVGHSVTVVVLQAAAARKVLDRDRAYVVGALAAIEQAGRQAMDELGRVLDVLSAGAGDGTGTSPGNGCPLPPGLAGLEQLLATTRAAGLPTRLSTDGDLSHLRADVSAVAFRVIQEGCTNVLRHARGAPTTVTVRVGDGEVFVAVANEPSPSSGGSAGGLATSTAMPAGSGRGLDGLAQRVATVGGRLVAEPRPNGGFGLCAWLPKEPG
jgi:signal transduction histidine kinase